MFNPHGHKWIFLYESSIQSLLSHLNSPKKKPPLESVLKHLELSMHYN